MVLQEKSTKTDRHGSGDIYVSRVFPLFYSEEGKLNRRQVVTLLLACLSRALGADFYVPLLSLVSRFAC